MYLLRLLAFYFKILNICIIVGLYFNKATDSCDYSKNVYCKKSKQKATTTTTTTTTTTAKPYTTPTARSTTRTTTEADTNYDVYDEYEDEDEYDDVSSKKDKLSDSIEDPKVLRELVNLVKKLGGVDRLEEYFRGRDESKLTTTTTGFTVKSPGRRLYERVLRTRQDTAAETNHKYCYSYLFI